MTERSEIVNKTAGYSFHIKIEKEVRTETGAKYPDKSVVSATLSGNDESFDAVVQHVKEAKKTIDEVLSGKTEKEEQDPEQALADTEITRQKEEEGHT